MKTILINSKAVKITTETYRRIEKIAHRKKLSFYEAVVFCLEKVI